MQIYVIQGDAIVPAEGEGAAFAGIVWENPLADPRPSADRLTARRTVLFSGWFGDGKADPRRGIFPGDFRTWSPAAWAALDGLCEGLRLQLMESGRRLCFRPHARHVLADPQACLTFLRRHAVEGGGPEVHQPFEVLLDPAAFLTPGMLGRAEDHLIRAFEALASHPQVPGVVLTNVEPVGEDGLRASPLMRGVLDPEMLVGLARRHTPETLWIVIGEELEAQMRLLR